MAEKTNYLITFKNLRELKVTAEYLDYEKDGIALYNQPKKTSRKDIVAFVPFSELGSVVEESSEVKKIQ